ncbi:MAG TPA: response regulator [Pirellulales bacterium]|jgi:DNA-binding response OmpR family regulator|nr:response regulator [Pirellulales bacterium]
MSLIPHSTVLVVDGFDESREVLRTALERRGFRVLEATHAAAGLAMARLHQPDLVLLDLDCCPTGSETAEEFASIAENDGSTLLLLGNLPSISGTSGSEFVAKPYHFKPLILRIEELLLRQRCGRAAA